MASNPWGRKGSTEEDVMELLSALLKRQEEEEDEPSSALGRMAKRGQQIRWNPPPPTGGMMSGMNTMMPMDTGEFGKIPAAMEGIGGMIGLAQGIASMADAGAFTKGRAGDYWKRGIRESDKELEPVVRDSMQAKDYAAQFPNRPEVPGRMSNEFLTELLSSKQALTEEEAEEILSGFLGPRRIGGW
jgi:hypothetical protein